MQIVEDEDEGRAVRAREDQLAERAADRAR